MAQTLFEKIWNDHTVSRSSGFPDTLYIDSHFINKITSPGAFEALRKRDVPIFRVKQTVAVYEPGNKSSIPVSDLDRFLSDLLFKNCSDFGIEIVAQKSNSHFSLATSPGQIIVCDPESTENFGAFGVIAIGVNPAQTEQVLATQCILMPKPRTMKIEVNGKLRKSLSAKDINHYLISEISSIGAKGYYVEFGGDTILSLDMDGRIEICNISREIGAVGGIIAPDELTYDYLKDRRISAEMGSDEENQDSWKNLFSDETSVFDEVLEYDAEDIRPGNYDISLSKLMSSTSLNEGPISYESAGVIQGYNETDYILSRKDSIEDFERSQVYRAFNGVNPL